ncbi:MAG TPA: hypothetical protein VLU25_02720 [Acidobacteriota bacterium]|nr:hypothetical protein [Acidobacteriota bacterium]
MRRIAKVLARGLALCLLLQFWASDAWACEVCYGKAESPIIDGMNMSVLFMLATTYVLIVGMAGGFFVLRRKALAKKRCEEGS